MSADAALVDVDGDGDLDALISNENPFAPGPTQGAQNRLYLNNGSGWFSEAPLPAATDQSVGMLTGDIDGDAAVDILVLNRGQERVLMGDGTGSFVEETTARIPLVDLTVSNVSSARGGALADLDDDGDLDLVIGNSRGQAVEYYKNDGSGVFVPASFGHVPWQDETISAFALVDLDHDGDQDVYLGNAGRFEGGPGGHGFFGAPIAISATTAAASSKSAPASISTRPAIPPPRRRSATSMATATRIWSWATPTTTCR